MKYDKIIGGLNNLETLIFEAGDKVGVRDKKFLRRALEKLDILRKDFKYENATTANGDIDEDEGDE